MGIQINKPVGGGGNSSKNGLQLEELVAPDSSEALKTSKAAIEENVEEKRIRRLEELLRAKFSCCFPK